MMIDYVFLVQNDRLAQLYAPTQLQAIMLR